MSKKIGILNSGGDVSGLNAVIASVVKSAHENGYETIGFIKGFEGLLDPIAYVSLTPSNVWEITGKGGTILKSVNKGRFPAKVAGGVLQSIDKQVLDQAKANLEKLGVETLVVIGGDGTLSAATQLSDLGVNIIGVPKTIDNDLSVTEKTFGFSTAVSVIVDAIDKLRTTAASHDRIFLVETMGRSAGWLALYSGVAAEADIILLPEFEFSYQSIIDRLRANKATGKNYQIIVIAEGAQVGGDKVYKAKMEKQESLLGGISELIMHELNKELGEEFELRNIVLGHVQRGGAPNSEDRILAQRFGEAVVEAAKAKEYGKMVALQEDEIVTVDIKSAVEKVKLVSSDFHLVKAAKNLGISFGN